jgi:arylsulfatase A-like enzyme
MTDAAHRPPNVVLLMADQLRWDAIGAYGNPVVKTPHLDRLAREGIRCDAAYVANPFCMPARASVLTGRWPHAHGLWDNGVRLPPDTVTLATVLANHGYHTGLVGKGHLDVLNQPGSLEYNGGWDDPAREAWHGPYYGFSEVHLRCGGHPPGGHYGAWLQREHPEAVPLLQRDRALEPPIAGAWKSALPVELHSSTWTGDQAVAFINRHGARPFFLWASFIDPHPPLCPPAPYSDMYDPGDMPLPVRRRGELDDKPPHFRGLAHQGTVARRPYGPPRDIADERRPDAHNQVRKAYYYGMTSLVDHNVGRILAALEAQRLLDDTLVVYVSDHGEMLGDHWLDSKGPWHYDGCTRIPLLFRYPSALPAGRVVTDFVSQCDVAPTICELLDVPYVSWPVRSDDLHPGGAAGPDTLPDAQGMSLVPALRGEGPARSQVLTEFEWRWMPGLHQKTLRTRDWRLTVYAGRRDGELYDLRADPQEFVNRFHDPAYRPAVAEMTAALLDEVLRTEGRLPPRVAQN